MALNETELTHVAEALQALVGAPVSGVWQPKRDRLVLGLGDRYLLLVPRGPFARVHTVGARPRNPGNPFSFQGVCRAAIRGPLTSLRKHPTDRVVDLAFGSNTLHLRLTGRSGGLWLLRGSAVVAAFDGPAPSELPPLPHTATGPPRAARFSPAGSEDWDRAAARWFGTRETANRLHERRVVLARALRTRLARDRRLLTALGRDLDKTMEAPTVRRQADALAAVLHTVPRGADQVEVQAVDGSEDRWSIALDPRRSAGDNLTRLYGRVRRLERGGDRVLDHMERVEARIRTLDAALVVVPDADAPTLAELEALAPRSGRRGARPPSQAWHEWRGPHDTVVLVGRNAAGNRRLTFQRARGDDFWFHLRGRPGAHVLLPVNKGKTPDLQTLLSVGQICLAHARIPEGEAADVQYTRARHVRSIKGAADGRVQVHNEKVLRIVRDPSALAGWTRDGSDELDVVGLAALTDRLAEANNDRRFSASDGESR